MKNKVNKRIIIITCVLCICVLSIVGTVEAVKNNINKIALEAIASNQKMDNSYNKYIDENGNSETGKIDFSQMLSDFSKDASGNTIDNTGDNNAVTCHRQILYDPQTKVAVMSVLVPDGWSASCNVDWSFLSENSPGRANVELISPNGDIDIFYMSHMEFINASDDSYMGGYNRNQMKLRTELDYMDAKGYTKHLLDSAGIVMNSSTQTDVNSSGEQKLREIAYSRGSNQERILKQVCDGAVKTPGTDTYVKFTDYDAQVYVQNGKANQGGDDFYVETICEEMMFELTTVTTLTAPTGILKFEYTEKKWEPYLFTITSFADEQTYKENFDFYRFLVSNMILCADFEYLNKTLGSQYAAKAIQANIEVSNYAHEVMMQYQQERMQQEDAWVKNFSDYIYDQTTYTMSDGAEVTVPTSADYVYSDGNDVIWSTSAMFEPGPGYTRIN